MGLAPRHRGRECGGQDLWGDAGPAGTGAARSLREFVPPESMVTLLCPVLHDPDLAAPALEAPFCLFPSAAPTSPLPPSLPSPPHEVMASPLEGLPSSATKSPRTRTPACRPPDQGHLCAPQEGAARQPGRSPASPWACPDPTGRRICKNVCSLGPCPLPPAGSAWEERTGSSPPTAVLRYQPRSGHGHKEPALLLCL